MGRHWIEHDPCKANDPNAPPVMGFAWYADAGNARNPRPHVRLAMWACENTSSCRYWMPYEEGDTEPELPRGLLEREA